MQKSILLGLALLFSSLVYAQSMNEKDSHEPANTTLVLQPKLGYSISKTTFNIAGNEKGTNPNVLSELIWDPTNSIEYGLDATYSNGLFFLRADILLNNTILGNVSDIDYDGDNRTLPYSKAYLSNHKGLGYSLKLQPGLYWQRNSEVSFVTYLSVDYSSKKLYLLNGKNWDKNHPEYTQGLESYYQYKFPNYGLGLQLDYQFSPKWSSQVNIEGYIAKYYAYGNWNLIDKFEKPISYEHKGNGKKIQTNLSLAYRLMPNTNLGISYNYNHFSVSNGKDYLYHRTDGLLKAKLNDANESKYTFLLSLQHSLSL